MTEDSAAGVVHELTMQYVDVDSKYLRILIPFFTEAELVCMLRAACEREVTE